MARVRTSGQRRHGIVGDKHPGGRNHGDRDAAVVEPGRQDRDIAVPQFHEIHPDGPVADRHRIDDGAVVQLIPQDNVDAVAAEVRNHAYLI